MTEQSVARIDLCSIVPSPFQHRRIFDDQSLRELAKSIQQDGLIQAITVRPVAAYFELIAGERRWRAAKLAELETIDARILHVNDLQARRLCATENLQRADLTSLEEIMALAELVDASLIEFSDEYAPLATVQEPKWRVKTLLMKLSSDKANGTSFMNKFVHKVESVFSGLPKPKEWEAFRVHDLPLLFTSSEVQQFSLKHQLNKSQTKAIGELQKAAPEVFKEIAASTTERAIDRLISLASDPVKPVAECKVQDIEDVRDLSAETIRQAAKNNATIQRHTASILVEQSFPSASNAAIETINPVQQGDWWQLGRHQLYCGDTSKPEFYQNLPQVDFAFADPPYGVNADDWDSAFFWDHDWLIDKAPIVAVTPGQPAIVQFSKKTAMPYRNSMASWITNGMTLSEFGYQNWIYLAVFAREGVSIFRQCQDVIRCTINMTETGESSHRGRKPAELIAKILELYCKDGGVVIDPFLGSGTTMLVSEKINRSCIGGELSPDYCWQIIARWELVTGNKAVKQ